MQKLKWKRGWSGVGVEGLSLGEPESRAVVCRGARFLVPSASGVLGGRFRGDCHDLPPSANSCHDLPPSAMICHGLSFLSTFSPRLGTGPSRCFQDQVRENVSARVRVRARRVVGSHRWRGGSLVGQMRLDTLCDLSPSATSSVGRVGRGSTWHRIDLFRSGATMFNGRLVRPQNMKLAGPSRAADDLGRVQRRGLVGPQVGGREACLD